MTDTACPNCGKPVRPGASFCGSCGHIISSTPSPGAQASPPLSARSVCPHCGKPVRPGAKFCPSCGKAIAPAEVQPAAQPPADQAPPPTPQIVSIPPKDASTPSPVHDQPPVPVRGPGMPAPPPAPPGDKKPQGFSRKYGLWIILTLALCFIVTISLVLLYKYDPLGLGFNPTSTGTVTPTVKASLTFTPTPTKLTDTPVPSATEIPSVTPTESATIAILTAAAQTLEAGLTQTSQTTTTPNIETPSPTETNLPVPSPTETGTPTTMPTLAIEDDFSGDLQANWISWGEPPPQIQNNELELTSANPGNSGVTSRSVIRLASGVTIQFTALVQESDPQNVILFDWDAGEYQRQPNDPPGTLHVQIGDGAQTFLISGTSFTCPNPLSDVRPHLYQIKVDQGLRVSFWVDGNRVCEKFEPSLQGGGHISFSGNGRIDDVKVTTP